MWTRVRDAHTQCLALTLANGILPYDPSFNPDLHPPVTSFDPLGIVNTQAGLRESWDPLIPNDHPSVASTSSLAHPNANDVNPSIQPVSAPDEALLAEFCKSTLDKPCASSAHLKPIIFVSDEDYLIPAMSITYIRSQRPQFAERIHSITNSCQVARLARQAVAATCQFSFMRLFKILGSFHQPFPSRSLTLQRPETTMADTESPETSCTECYADQIPSNVRDRCDGDLPRGIGGHIVCEQVSCKRVRGGRLTINQDAVTP